MFPLEFPLAHLKRCDAEKTVLVDTFCGRGQTLYAAAIHGIDCYGIDSSPVAAAIARAKLANTSLNRVLSLADELLRDAPHVSPPRGAFWERAFHASTLRDLCKLRAGLLRMRESNTTALLKALLLGALHGPKSKHWRYQSYFSNQMPRTYASKPDYSLKYWKSNHCHPRRVDVRRDRKSTRLNSSHQIISYAVFCL